MNDLRQSMQPALLGKRISRSNNYAGNGGGKVAGEQSGDHGPQSEAGQVPAALRRESADAANLDGDAGEISEAAESVSGEHKAARVERCFCFGDGDITKELIEHNSLAERL